MAFCLWLDAPLRFPVVDILESRTLGSLAVGGKIETGAVRVGSRLTASPSGETATIKGIEVGGQVVFIDAVCCIHSLTHF